MTVKLVLAEASLGLLVLGRGRAVEEVEVVGAVLDAVAEDIDRAALRDLALETGEELAARGTVLVEAEGGGGVGLGGVEEGSELDEVDAVLAVVVVMVAGGPTDAAVAGGWFADGAGRTGDRRDLRSGPCRSGVRGRVRLGRWSWVGVLEGGLRFRSSRSRTSSLPVSRQRAGRNSGRAN